VNVQRFDGDREQLRPLFRLADDSEQEIDSYLAVGDVVVAVDADTIVGHLHTVPGRSEGTVEVKNMAVLEDRQGCGVGRALVAAAVVRCRAEGVARLVVATAAADIGNLRFYQRQGFRLSRVERDAFGPPSGYADDIVIDGIPLRDRVWLDLEL
jgi:GNAT superfamily N-acetyltransferase